MEIIGQASGPTMFKIVASFTRPNTDHDFFNDIYTEYKVINQIQANAGLTPGYLGIDENVYRDNHRCDKALCFENEAQFLQFVKENQTLLDQRLVLIKEYCNTTGHEYKYYIINDKDSAC